VIASHLLDFYLFSMLSFISAELFSTQHPAEHSGPPPGKLPSTCKGTVKRIPLNIKSEKTMRPRIAIAHIHGQWEMNQPSRQSLVATAKPL